MLYQGSVFSSDLPAAMRLLGEVVREPALEPADVDEVRAMAGYDAETMVDKPDVFLPDLVHGAAFGPGLGNPMLCPPERAAAMKLGACVCVRVILAAPGA